MKKEKVVSAIVLPVLVVVGILAVSVYAKGKPSSPPGLSKQVLITVSGDIKGSGFDAADMDISFSSIFDTKSGEKVANPDGSLRVYGTKKGSRTLSYYYCTDIEDQSTYKRLRIFGGMLVESNKNHETILFPAGSDWAIGFKSTTAVEMEGTLSTDTMYIEEEIRH